MPYPSDLIRIAKKEIGYHEKATAAAEDLDSKTANSGAGNYTKYARDLDAVGYFNGRKQGFEWCAVFNCWLEYQLHGDGLTTRAALYQPDAKWNCGAGCTQQSGYFRENNAFFTAPKPGDWVFYGKPGDEEHTGRVVEVSDRTLYTIEGNVQNQVLLIKHAIDDPAIVGFGRPKYEAGDPCVIYVIKTGDTLNKIAETYKTTAEAIAEENDLKNPDLITSGTILVFKRGSDEWHTSDIFAKYGDRNTAVKVIQALLLKRGLRLTYDGYFGAETRAAVMAWQDSQNITVDGIVGDETLETL